MAKAPAGNRKLTWPQVEAIRLLLCSGQSQRRVARLFNVSRGAISRIARGSTWKGKDRDEGRVTSDEVKSKKAKDSPVLEEDGGVWLVTEPVQLPGMLLEIPCGMFQSREQAQAYLREHGERFQLRRIEGDWNRGSGELRVQGKILRCAQDDKVKAVSSGEFRVEKQNKGKEKA